MKSLSRPIVLFFILAGLSSFCFVSATEEININSASLEDLIKIIHIGEARAIELISLRPFSSLDDLARIKGIGSSRVNDIRKQGLAWTDESYEAEPQAIETQPFSEKGLAAAGEQFPQRSSFPLLIAAALAIFCGVIILILKKKVKIS